MKAEEFVVMSSNDLVRHGISSLIQLDFRQREKDREESGHAKFPIKLDFKNNQADWSRFLRRLTTE